MRLRVSSLAYLLIICVLIAPVFSPVVYASVLYGPEKYTRTAGSISGTVKVDNSIGSKNGGNSDLILNGCTSITNSGNSVAVALAYGPVTVESNKDHDVYYSNFSVSNPHGNYTLFVKNGDLISDGTKVPNASSSAIVWFNGAQIFGPSDFKEKGGLLKKKVSVGTDNQIKVELRSKPGSQLNIWVEDETPDVVITYPWYDTETNTTITVMGHVADKTISSVTLNQNGNIFSVPVVDGNFSTPVTLAWINNITISAIDRTDMLRSTSLLLDGDYLNMQDELKFGFDPLNPDSDSSLTLQNEAGNGVIDGQEYFGDPNSTLPIMVKSRLGCDPLKNDTDGDGLTDYFEGAKLIPFTSPASNDTDKNGVPDWKEDIDQDGLTNLQEQTCGTNPLVADADKDGLNDSTEIALGSNPLVKDSDNDGLQDDGEMRLGMNPNNPDTDGDGILDGDETYTSSLANETLGISVSVTGKGDLGKELIIKRETLDYYTNVSALVSPLADVRVNGTINFAQITMQCDPSLNPANLSLCYYNQSRGLYVPVPSKVDTANRTISANVTHLSIWGVFDTNALQEMYNSVSNFNEAAVEHTPTSVLSLNGHSQSWPNDIRFTGADGNPLNYWIESYDDGSAVIWVKASQIPASPGNAKLNVNYGKAGDTGASDGAATFLAFHGPTSASYADSNLVGYDNLAYEASVRRIGELNSVVYGLKSQDNSDYLYLEFNGSGSKNGIAKNSETVGSVLISNGFGRSASGRYEVVKIGSYQFDWDGTGRVYLSGSPTTIISTAADDAFDVSTQYGSKSFNGGYWSVYHGIPDITSICRLGSNNVTVYVRDIYGTYIGCNPVYITNGKNFAVVTEPGVPAENEWHNIRITRSGATAKFYYDDRQIQPSLAVCLPDESLGMFSSLTSAADQAYAFVRKYTPNEPSFSQAGLETQVSGSPSGYTYTTTIDIQGSPDGALTDYPVKVKVYALSPDDSDGDGLINDVETQGYKDAKDRYYQPTDPNSKDSDGDGLEDGEEVGELRTDALCGHYYDLISDPTKADTDGDGVDDEVELKAYDTEPRNPDTDGDTLWDGDEIFEYGTSPISDNTDGDDFSDLFEVQSQQVPVAGGWLFNPVVWDMPISERENEYSMGAVWGECAAPYHDNIYFLLGWLSPCFVPVLGDLADLRDFGAALEHLDAGSAVINGIAVLIDAANYLADVTVVGAAPGYGANTAYSVTATCAKFVISHRHTIGFVLPIVIITLEAVNAAAEPSSSQAAPMANSVMAVKSVNAKANVIPIDLIASTTVYFLNLAEKDGSGIYTTLYGKKVSDAKFVEWGGYGSDALEFAQKALINGANIDDVDNVIKGCARQGVKFEDVTEFGHVSSNIPLPYWMDKGNSKTGLIHFVGRHIAGIFSHEEGKKTSLWPCGIYIARVDKTTPNAMTQEQVFEMIRKYLKEREGTVTVKPFEDEGGNLAGHTYKIKYVLDSGDQAQFGLKKMEIWLDQDGRFLAALPEGGKNFIKW
jgi:hypothetical protein